MIRVAVDAMGGDHAPYAIVKGAEAAWREQIAEPVLVGDENRIRPLLDAASKIEVVHTSSYVEMRESPSSALRKKRDSSVNKAYALQCSGDVEAVVTAGNSGAAMAFAIFTLGRIQGVERPAIMSFHPNVKGTLSVLLDAGANVDCKPAPCAIRHHGSCLRKIRHGDREAEGWSLVKRRGGDKRERADERGPCAP